MDLPQDLSYESFSEEVIRVVLSELGRFREDCRVHCRTTPLYYKETGKAAAVLGLIHQHRITSTMAKFESRLMSSRYFFETFAASFAETFFRSMETVPRKHYFLILLTFSGVLGVMADFCLQRKQIHLIQECCFNLEMELEMSANDFKEIGSWEGLMEYASPLARLYDSIDWKDSGVEKLSMGVSDILC